MNLHFERFNTKGVETKNLMSETKRVAQNTQSYKFSAAQTPREIQNLFLKRALIPFILINTGLQMALTIFKYAFVNIAPQAGDNNDQ